MQTRKDKMKARVRQQLEHNDKVVSDRPHLYQSLKHFWNLNKNEAVRLVEYCTKIKVGIICMLFTGWGGGGVNAHDN